ncbi:HipA N-terminal domain-containing protein [Pedobacter aquatilis]|uniref:HipA N-terminal domain-containing protein n=1 Tax=Pedobacter aquatilis TaxID=351343 RepID=UPI00292E6FE7|nr:HipA N-terminal domain-containing protein [Pedobacter aquatilis]
MRQAAVFFNDILAGYLSENDNRQYSFIYESTYFLDPKLPSISLTMPKEQKEYVSETLFPFFYNMLSEGVNKKMQSRQYQLDENDAFGLLLKTAGSDTIGAITVKEIQNGN